MLPLSLEQSLHVSKLCKNMLLVDKSIICISVVNKRGRIIESEFRAGGLLWDLSDMELEMLYMQRALQTSMIKELDGKHGCWNCTVTERDFVTEVLLPFCDGLIFVMLESGPVSRDLVAKLRRTVEEHLILSKAGLILQ